MKRNNSNEWVRYLDNKSNCYYWYSNKTGETYWDEENNNDNDNDNNYQEEVEEEEIEVVEEDDIHLTNIRNPHAQDYSDEDDDDNDDDIEEQKNHQYSENDNQNDNYSDDDENDDDENEQLISNLIQKDILFRTQQDITFFTYCFIIHALVIEAPLCIIESFIRSFIFFILSLFYLFIFILSFPLSLLIQNINKSPNYPNNNNHDTISTTISTTTTTTKSSLPSLLYISIFLFIESLISFSLGLSFIIPGIILIIYRDFNGIDEWKLHPIPSIMGWIDPRRLAVITLGQGSSANNSSVQWKLISSSNNISSIFISEKKVEIMDSIKLNIYQNESTIFHQPFCFPRDILSFLRSNRP